MANQTNMLSAVLSSDVTKSALEEMYFKFFHNGRVNTAMLQPGYQISQDNNAEAHIATLMSALEEAHWFYQDHLCRNQQLGQYDNYWNFVPFMLEQCEGLRHLLLHNQFFQNSWKAYKAKVLICGCIMLDASFGQVLLVQSAPGSGRYSGCWGFPQGKISQGEEPADCAVREAFEETGYDASSLILQDKRVDILGYGGKQFCLFVTPGVPTDFPFHCECKQEVHAIKWISTDQLTALPEEVRSAADGNPQVDATASAHKFNPIVSAVWQRIKDWVHDKRMAAASSQPGLYDWGPPASNAALGAHQRSSSAPRHAPRTPSPRDPRQAPGGRRVNTPAATATSTDARPAGPAQHPPHVARRSAGSRRARGTHRQRPATGSTEGEEAGSSSGGSAAALAAGRA